MAARTLIRLLPRPVLPAIWRELGALELTAGRGVAAPDAAGDGRPVLLVPGFLAGDGSLRPLAEALRAAGHSPHLAGIRRNVGCSEAAVASLVTTAERLVERHGRRIAVVGHSRGGLFARVLARRRPDLVFAVVMLGSPVRDQLAVHPLVWASAAALATAGSLRLPGVLRWSCGTSRCCSAFDRDLAGPLPDGVQALSVYSRRDGVVDWRACIDPSGRRLEVSSTHCGMTAHAPALWAVARAIA